MPPDDEEGWQPGQSPSVRDALVLLGSALAVGLALALAALAVAVAVALGLGALALALLLVSSPLWLAGLLLWWALKPSAPAVASASSV